MNKNEKMFYISAKVCCHFVPAYLLLMIIVEFILRTHHADTLERTIVFFLPSLSAFISWSDLLKTQKRGSTIKSSLFPFV